jgi:hypothetical protein
MSDENPYAFLDEVIRRRTAPHQQNVMRRALQLQEASRDKVAARMSQPWGSSDVKRYLAHSIEWNGQQFGPCVVEEVIHGKLLVEPPDRLRMDPTRRVLRCQELHIDDPTGSVKLSFAATDAGFYEVFIDEAQMDFRLVTDDPRRPLTAPARSVYCVGGEVVSLVLDVPAGTRRYAVLTITIRD